MTSGGGITEQVFGFDLLTEQKMKPWWETVHGYLLATTITISGILVYFTSTGQQVDCLPTTQNASHYTDSQINLVNGYCTGQIPWYALYAGMLNFLAASFILVASNVWLSHPDVIDAFRTFVKAANIINGLHSRSNKLNQMAVTPVFAEYGEGFELRKACLLLWSQQNRIQRLYMIRNIIVIGLTLSASVITLTVSIMLTSLVNNPHYECQLTEEETRAAMLRGRYYFCSYSHANIIFPFVLLCGLAFIGQVFALTIAIFKLRWKPFASCDMTTFSDEFLQAKACCYFMKTFWTNASPVDSQRFAGLLDYIFSPDAITSMVRYIPQAITNTFTAPTTAENPSLTPYNGPTYGFEAIPNPDLVYVELYVHMHRHGGNNALSRLYKLFEDRDSGVGYRDIREAMAKVKFTDWNDDAKNFIKAAGKKKHWDLLVCILNAYKYSNPITPYPEKMKCGLYDFNLTDRPTEKGLGYNVLYYALRKEEGESDFKFNAIKHILACIKGDNKLTVYTERFVMSAEEFVSFQYEGDPTFTEELKLQLLIMIKSAEDSNYKFAARTI